MNQREAHPFVTAMIVVRNEEEFIGRAVMSLLKQRYPKEYFELLIIDGNSEDQTLLAARQAVETYENECGLVEVHYFENPKRNLAAGWNIGIKKAKGEYVVRIDAHAKADPDLISKCVKVLQEKEDVVCAGGRIEAEAFSKKGEVISDVLSSPFGIGNAKFRYSEKSGYVDTVAYGVYRKSIFEEAGYFNEEFMRNQDNDMHGRIKKHGGKFYLEASVKSTYYSRGTIKGMAKQAFGNGKWSIIGWRKSESKEGISLRHMIPFCFVLGNLFLLIGSFFHTIFRRIYSAMYLTYFVLAIFFAAKKTRNIGNILKMCICYWVLHISYGTGSLFEILDLKSKRMQ